MNRGEHVAIGFGSAFVITYLFFPNLLFFTWCALLGSIAPDIIEPATSYMHRKDFHSKRMLLFSGIITLFCLISGLFINWFYFGFYFFYCLFSISLIGVLIWLFFVIIYYDLFSLGFLVF